MKLQFKRVMPTMALMVSAGLLGACSSGGSSGGSSNVAGSQTVKTSECAGGANCGVLDPVQDVINDVLGGQIATTLPAPLGPVVGCASDAVNNVVDVPDALLSALQNGVTTQDPEVVLAAVQNMGTALANAAFNLQGLLMSLAGSEGPCSLTGGDLGLPIPGLGGSGGLPGLGALPLPGVGGVDGLPGLGALPIPGLDALPIPGLGGTGGGDTDGPTGTPLDLALAPLADGLQTLLDTLGSAAGDTPASAALDPIIAGFEALLGVLQGDLPSDFDLSSFAKAGGTNPFADVLGQLQSQLGDLSGGGLPGGIPGLPGGGADDLDLAPLTDILAGVTDALGMAIAEGRGQLEGAAGSEVPVIGGLLLAVETALTDTNAVLDAAGEYDGVAVNSAVENLLENTLGNVLTEVLPLRMIGEQAGVDIAGQVQAGISQGVTALSSGTLLLLGPLFDTALDDALAPALDPIEGLVAQLLAAAPVPGDLNNLLSGGLTQLLGTLTSLAPSGGFPAVPGLPGGNPLDLLLGGLGGLPGLPGLPGAPGVSSAGLDGATGTPLDLLLGTLADNDPTGLLGGLLEGLLGGLLGALGGLAP